MKNTVLVSAMRVWLFAIARYLHRVSVLKKWFSVHIWSKSVRMIPGYLLFIRDSVCTAFDLIIAYVT